MEIDTNRIESTLVVKSKWIVAFLSSRVLNNTLRKKTLNNEFPQIMTGKRKTRNVGILQITTSQLNLITFIVNYI